MNNNENEDENENGNGNGNEDENEDEDENGNENDNFKAYHYEKINQHSIGSHATVGYGTGANSRNGGSPRATLTEACRR